MLITTCSYKEFPKVARPGLLPVGITLGSPPRGIKYHLRMWKALGPKSAYFRAPAAEFVRRYVDDLDALGPKAITDRLNELAREEQCTDVCLLCFEDLGAPHLWCHRTVFRDWWLLTTGEQLTELGRMYVAPTPPQDDLFTDLESGA